MPKFFPTPDDLLKGTKPSFNSTDPQIPSPQALLGTLDRPQPTAPSFGSNLVSKATDIGKSLLSKAGSFFKNTATDLKDVVTGDLKVTPDDVLTGIKKTAIGSATGLEALSQGFLEGVGRIIKSASVATLGADTTDKIANAGFFKDGPAPITISSFSRDVTGKDSIPTYQDIYDRAHQYATEQNATPSEAGTFAGLTVFGMAFADNPIAGPGKGSVLKLTEQGVKDLAIAGTDDAVKEILKREIPKITDPQLEALVPVFRNASTPEEVQAIVKHLDEISKANIKEAITPEPPKPEDVAAKVAQDPAIRPSQLDLLNQPAADQTFRSPEDIAKQYYDEVLAKKSADEPIVIAGDDMKEYFGKDFAPERSDDYSKASYLTIQRAIDENPGRELTILGGGPGSGKSELLGKSLIDSGYNGILYDNSLSNYDGIKSLIERARANGNPVEIVAIVSDVDEARRFTLKRELKTGRPVTDEAFARGHAGFTSTAKRLLEDGVVQPNEMTLFDFRGVKTFDEALKRIKLGVAASKPIDLLKKVQYNEGDLLARVKNTAYDVRPESVPEKPGIRAGNDQSPRGNGADRGSKTDAGAAARKVQRGTVEQLKFSPNLLREIAESTTPADIQNTLQREFPHISDAAAIALSQRLKNMHRTADIEGVLKIVNDVNEKLAAGKPIAKKATAKVADLPPTIGELMSESEQSSYIDLMSRSIGDKERAALAQQEYDVLWEHADQKIIDKANELTVQRDIMREYVENDIGREINALYKGTFLSPDDVSLEELIQQRPGRSIDSKLSELMSGQLQPGVADTTGQAQRVLDSWRKAREQLKEVEAQLREIRPAARAARIMQNMIEDVPVIARERAGQIESLANPDDIRKKFKDISGFSGQTRDLYRNFEHVFGEKFPQVKKVILDPFDKSKGDMIDEITKLGDRLKEKIEGELGIQRLSKEDVAIQLYGEGKINHEELIARVGNKRAEDVIKAAAWFRAEYDRLLDEVNKVRAKIYPNNPSKLIPKRKDYFRHFRELGETFKDLVDLFESPAGIDPQLAGLSEWTKPATKYLSFAKERLGKDTDVSAIGGFLNYAPSFAYAKHIDPHIGQFRYLRRRLADVAPTPDSTGFRLKPEFADVDPQIATKEMYEQVKEKGINNFLVYLDHFANELAGKTNPLDRWLQDTIPGGRRTFRVINWLNQRVKANQIVGNLSSSVSQIFNVPQGIASAKLHSFAGIQRTLASIFTENEPMKASSFIKERYAGNIADRFNIDWVEHPVKAGTKQAKDFAVWLTQALDEAGTKFIWNSHYAKAIAEHIDNPIKYADDETRKLVAGRGVGEIPLIQKSKIFQLAAPFQLEVGNLWHVMGSFVKRKDFAALAILFVTNYLMNRAAEEIRGNRVVFDPIESLIDGSTQAADELSDTGNARRAAVKFLGRQLGEIMSNIPVGQTVAAATGDQWVQDVTQKLTGTPIDKKELFGAADPSRFGSGLLVTSGLADPFYKLLPPFGGAQLKRTWDGVSAMLSGEVRGANGKLSYQTSTNPLSVLQAFLFGKNATPEARQFFDERDDLFQRVYHQTANRTELSLEAESEWADVQKLAKKDPQAAVAKMQQIEKDNPLLADAIGKIADDEALGLDGRDRLVKMLGVENGERAKYIADSLQKMKTRDEQIAFLQNLDDKKLISDQVFEQLKVLLPGVIKDQ